MDVNCFFQPNHRIIFFTEAATVRAQVRLICISA